MSRRRLRRPAWTLLAVTLLPLLGPAVAAARAEGRGRVHPCGAPMPAASEDAAPSPVSDPPVPCGAALKLPCCNQVAALSSAGAGVPPAPPALLVAHSPQPVPLLTSPERSCPSGGEARAAPDLLATTVLRF